jgi:predicted RNA-binding protein associated with RNAse of E/G family
VLERSQLRVTHPDAPYSVFLFTNHDGSFRGWYVNFERPQQRTQIGFDYEDDLLDIWIPVGAEPELLDEDELEEAVERGFVSPERAAEIHATADRVLADPPWPTGWEDWRPEPGWQRPLLPPGWDLVES